MITKILMVCLGNICRLPLAEGILKNKVHSSKIFVDSAGTASFHVGNKPDFRSIAVAQKNGIDISTQRCRKFKIQDFKNFDIIYAMDKSNYKNIISLTNDSVEIAKVKLLLDEIDMLEKEVPDPYYGGKDGFEYVFKLIDSACNAIAKRII